MLSIIYNVGLIVELAKLFDQVSETYPAMADEINWHSRHVCCLNASSFDSGEESLYTGREEWRQVVKCLGCEE